MDTQKTQTVYRVSFRAIFGNDMRKDFTSKDSAVTYCRQIGRPEFIGTIKEIEIESC